MSTERIRVHPETLRREKRDILQFALSHIAPKEGGSVFMTDIFAAYQAWRKRQHLGTTELNIDGFGRMFPKTFNRRTLCLNGETLKGIKEVKIV